MEDQSPVDEFISLLTTYQHSIYSYVLTRVVSMADADDVMQDVSAEMWRSFGQYERNTNFLAWGMKIAHHKILDYRKKTQNHHKYLSDETIELLDTDKRRPTHVADQQIDQLKKCINQLPPQLRGLIRKRYSDGISSKVIASQQGKNVHVVYRMLAKARELLLGCIKRSLVTASS